MGSWEAWKATESLFPECSLGRNAIYISWHPTRMVTYPQCTVEATEAQRNHQLAKPVCGLVPGSPVCKLGPSRTHRIREGLVSHAHTHKHCPAYSCTGHREAASPPILAALRGGTWG